MRKRVLGVFGLVVIIVAAVRVNLFETIPSLI